MELLCFKICSNISTTSYKAFNISGIVFHESKFYLALSLKDNSVKLIIICNVNLNVIKIIMCPLQKITQAQYNN